LKKIFKNFSSEKAKNCLLWNKLYTQNTKQPISNFPLWKMKSENILKYGKKPHRNFEKPSGNHGKKPHRCYPAILSGR